MKRENGAPRPVTAHDVARVAGVSQSAVSRTFTPGASVSDRTRKRVLAAAQGMGYRPNLIASSLSTGRLGVVGVAVPSLGNPFYSELVDGLAAAFLKFGFRVMLFSAPHGASADPVLEEILSYRLDGLILVSAQLSSRLADECHARGLPVVMVNRKTGANSVSSVTGDNLTGARQVAAFLAAGGHARYAYLAGLDSSSTSRDREAGYREQLAHLGLPTPTKANGNYTVSDAALAARALLAGERRADAIFCANDQMALVAMDVARSEFGLEVGREVSIVGFDNTAVSAWPAFRLTTFSQPIDAMVDRTLEAFNIKRRDITSPPVAQVVCGALIVRASARVPERGLELVDDHCVWTP